MCVQLAFATSIVMYLHHKSSKAIFGVVVISWLACIAHGHTRVPTANEPMVNLVDRVVHNLVDKLDRAFKALVIRTADTTFGTGDHVLTSVSRFTPCSAFLCNPSVFFGISHSVPLGGRARLAADLRRSKQEEKRASKANAESLDKTLRKKGGDKYDPIQNLVNGFAEKGGTTLADNGDGPSSPNGSGVDSGGVNVSTSSSNVSSITDSIQCRSHRIQSVAFMKEQSVADFEVASMGRLDFQPVLTRLISRTRLRRAGELIAASSKTLSNNLTTIRNEYELVSEITSLPDTGSLIPLRSDIDVRGEIARLSSVTALEVEDIVRIQECIKSLQELTEFCEAADLPRVKLFAEKIEIDPALIEELDGGIENGQLSGNRFPEIQRCRDEVDRVEASTKRRVQSLMRNPSPDSLTNGTSTRSSMAIFNDRIAASVLGARGSSTDIAQNIGAMQMLSEFAIEPQQLVSITNERNDAYASLKIAETRALSQLSLAVGKSKGSLLKSIEAAAELDAARAKASVGHAWSGVVPEVRSEGRIKVRGLKHAALVLASEESIGNSIDLDMRHGSAPQGIVITGPNGGGKTVVIKAVGLAAILVRLGVPIPAEPNARVDIFSPVLAVVGDDQKLSEKTSTFQAHCLSLKGLLRNACPSALLIADEVGTGTDPMQGVMLAQAVVEECLERGAVVLTTTHYPRLKRFAARDGRVVQGAMLLNQKGEPTFRLVVPGVGKSNGIETAKLAFGGEFDGVVERARSLMSDQELKLNDLLDQSEERIAAMEITKEQLRHEMDMTTQTNKTIGQTLREAENKLMEPTIFGLQEWRRKLQTSEQNLLKQKAIQRKRMLNGKVLYEALGEISYPIKEDVSWETEQLAQMFDYFLLPEGFALQQRGELYSPYVQCVSHAELAFISSAGSGPEFVSQELAKRFVIVGQSAFEQGLAFQVEVVSGQGTINRTYYQEMLTDEQVDELVRSELAAIKLRGIYALGSAPAWRVFLDISLNIAEKPKDSKILMKEILRNLKHGKAETAAQQLQTVIPESHRPELEAAVESRIGKLRFVVNQLELIDYLPSASGFDYALTYLRLNAEDDEDIAGWSKLANAAMQQQAFQALGDFQSLIRDAFPERKVNGKVDKREKVSGYLLKGLRQQSVSL